MAVQTVRKLNHGSYTYVPLIFVNTLKAKEKEIDGVIFNSKPCNLNYSVTVYSKCPRSGGENCTSKHGKKQTRFGSRSEEYFPAITIIGQIPWYNPAQLQSDYIQ